MCSVGPKDLEARSFTTNYPFRFQHNALQVLVLPKGIIYIDSIKAWSNREFEVESQPPPLTNYYPPQYYYAILTSANDQIQAE